MVQIIYRMGAGQREPTNRTPPHSHRDRHVITLDRWRRQLSTVYVGRAHSTLAGLAAVVIGRNRNAICGLRYVTMAYQPKTTRHVTDPNLDYITIRHELDSYESSWTADGWYSTTWSWQKDESIAHKRKKASACCCNYVLTIFHIVHVECTHVVDRSIRCRLKNGSEDDGTMRRWGDEWYCQWNVHFVHIWYLYIVYILYTPTRVVWHPTNQQEKAKRRCTTSYPFFPVHNHHIPPVNNHHIPPVQNAHTYTWNNVFPRTLNIQHSYVHTTIRSPRIYHGQTAYTVLPFSTYIITVLLNYHLHTEQTITYWTYTAPPVHIEHIVPHLHIYIYWTYCTYKQALKTHINSHSKKQRWTNFRLNIYWRYMEHVLLEEAHSISDSIP